MKHREEKRMERIEQSIRDMGEIVKMSNIYVLGILEGKERSSVWRNNGWEFSNTAERHQPTASRISPNPKLKIQRKISMLRHLLVKMLKTKDRENLKSQPEEKDITLKVTDISTETMNTNRQWNDIFKVLKFRG